MVIPILLFRGCISYQNITDVTELKNVIFPLFAVLTTVALAKAVLPDRSV